MLGPVYRSRIFLALIGLSVLAGCSRSKRSTSDVTPTQSQPSIARQWNDMQLEAIRNDFARPTVHARNLFHLSAAMWDAWAAYEPTASGLFVDESHTAVDVAAARREAISFAAYRILAYRFAKSPGAAETLEALDVKMASLGYDANRVDTMGDEPLALGNRIAMTIIGLGATDGSNEANDYANLHYEPINWPLFPTFPGNRYLLHPNRWQPLSLEYNVDQSGNPIPLNVLPFLGPEWGQCIPFALKASDLTVYNRDGFDYWVYHDPGAPPKFAEGADYREGFEQVLEWSSLLDPNEGGQIDISPAARGNNPSGTNDGRGRTLNPATGEPYPSQWVPAGDYYRVLAEFWADGPHSETPPGHWYVIANYVSDHPELEHRLGGQGEVLDRLEWDVKLYLTLGGTVHDAAVAAWGVKGWYDYLRPISALRMMGDLGQRSLPSGPRYNAEGVQLVPGRVELVTMDSIEPGARHEHLAGQNNANIDKIAVRAWRGPDYITDPNTTTAGVGWILLEDWWPYQRPTFVTPPFAGYVSGHSTFSRAAASVMTAFTGSEFFPGGVGEFKAPKNEFLVFEEGPSVDITLQWATYYDAADECSLSRIYGGIHPPADDIPGRLMGAKIGPDAFAKALTLFGSN